VMVNEAPHRLTTIDHGTLARGARLRFDMQQTAARE
jgi:hypothetical protein